MIADIQLSVKDCKTKFSVYLNYDTDIPVLTYTSLEVKVHLSYNGHDVVLLTQTVCYEFGNTLYYIPSGIISSKQKYLKVINVGEFGDASIEWKAHKLLARAKIITQKDETRSNKAEISETKNN